MVDLRSAAATVLRSRTASALLSALEAADRGRHDRVLVVTYHRIDEPAARPHLWPRLISATPAEFATHVEFYARRMRPLTVDELLEALRSGSAPRRAVHVTIDDAYRDVAEHAWPALERHGVPATLFVPTGFVDEGGAFWWDRLHHAMARTSRRSVTWQGVRLELGTPEQRAAAYDVVHERIREAPHDLGMGWLDALTADMEVPEPPREILDWRELRTLANAGLAMGAHTRRHPRLDRVDLNTAVTEIRGSFEDLQRQVVGPHRRILAYPSGDHAEPAVEAAASCGVDAAFTTRRAAVRLGEPDMLRLPRVNVGRRASLAAIRVQAGSWMELLGR